MNIVFAGTAAVGMILLALATGLAVVWVQRWVSEHILPSARHEAHAKAVNMPRRHLESLTSWEKRTFAAHVAIDDASEAFIAEATRLGHFRMFSNGRAGAYFLPIGNQVALRLDRARNGRVKDGDHEPGKPEMLSVRVLLL